MSYSPALSSKSSRCVLHAARQAAKTSKMKPTYYSPARVNRELRYYTHQQQVSTTPVGPDATSSTESTALHGKISHSPTPHLIFGTNNAYAHLIRGGSSGRNSEATLDREKSRGSDDSSSVRAGEQNKSASILTSTSSLNRTESPLSLYSGSVNCDTSPLARIAASETASASSSSRIVDLDVGVMSTSPRRPSPRTRRRGVLSSILQDRAMKIVGTEMQKGHVEKNREDNESKGASKRIGKEIEDEKEKSHPPNMEFRLTPLSSLITQSYRDIASLREAGTGGNVAPVDFDKVEANLRRFEA